MKKTNDELIYDFERELEKTNIPFKDLLKGKYYSHLLREYTSAEIKPSLDLYVNEYFTEQQIQDGLNGLQTNLSTSTNKGSIDNNIKEASFETRLNNLTNEFYNLVNTNQLPEKYYCQDITKTAIVKTFFKVDGILEILKKSVIFENSDIYKEVEIRIKSIELAIKNTHVLLANDLLQSIIDDDNNFAIYAHVWCSDNRSNNGYLFDKWLSLKDHFNVQLNELIENRREIAGTPTQSVSAKNKLLDIAFLGLNGDNIDKYYATHFARWKFDNSDEVWMDGKLLNPTQKRMIKAALYNIKPKPTEILTSDKLNGSELTEKRFIQFELERINKTGTKSLAKKFNIEDYKQYLEDLAKDLEKTDIFKDANGWINWMVKNPDLAENEYPNMTNEMVTRIKKWPPHTTANIIQNLPKNFVTWKQETELSSGITRKKKIQEHIELLSGVLHNWKYDTAVENAAIESVKDELSELLEYWQCELRAFEAIPKTPKLKIDQIALFYVYENKQITRANGNDIAIQYGHNSGEKLFQRYTFFSSTANRKGKPNPCTAKKLQNKIELIESVVTLLSPSTKGKANDEVKILRSILQTEYQ